MRNFYEIVKEDLHFNKFEVNELIFVEYSCPLEDEQVGLFSQSDYIVHVLSGKKSWKTLHGEWTLGAGQTMYIKKGAALIRQYFDEEFCILGFFVSDELIREAILEVIEETPFGSSRESHAFSAAVVQSDPLIDGFFQSMLLYFRGQEQPMDSILRLKLKELLLNIIGSRQNPQLTAYFRSVAENAQPFLPQIMEANFCYNLSLEEYAKLTHRSLSTFKRDFKDHFQTTPGKWLLARRLEYAAHLLQNSTLSITQIAFDCGFEDLSHFSRVFKHQVGQAPSDFRKAPAGALSEQ